MTNIGILAIDDDPISLRLMRVLLARDGYDVRAATDPYEATALLDVFHPRLVLCDIDFNGAGATRFMRRLKDDPRTADAPVVAVATADPSARAAMFLAGCDAYVPKPFTPGALLGVVARHLGHVSCPLGCVSHPLERV